MLCFINLIGLPAEMVRRFHSPRKSLVGTSDSEIQSTSGHLNISEHFGALNGLQSILYCTALAERSTYGKFDSSIN